MGTAHGLAFADEIRAYTDKRVRLSLEGTGMSPAEALAVAELMLDAHRDYDADLFTEMLAMAAAAGISPAEAVIVGGYTDFIDTMRRRAGGSAFEDTCTTVITPDTDSGGAGFLAQTWDMHASATPHVFMLDARPGGRPGSLIFTTHGTLGQIGMNDAGIAIGINNLTMDDGDIGVTWPFVVRKALDQTDFEAALEAVVDADLAGGHSFLLFDARGNGAVVEATTTTTSIERLDGRPLVHTNHCLTEAAATVESARPDYLVESSDLRLEHATAYLAASPAHTLESLTALLRDEASICRRSASLDDYESSGAVIMRPRTGDMWACWGVPADNDFEHFRIPRG